MSDNLTSERCVAPVFGRPRDLMLPHIFPIYARLVLLISSANVVPSSASRKNKATGITTTRAAFLVVVVCISRIPSTSSTMAYKPTVSATRRSSNGIADGQLTRCITKE